MNTFRTHNWLTDPIHSELYLGTEGPGTSPDPFECWLLGKLASDAEVVLEIGSWRGRSGVFLADGLKRNGRSKQRLICVDWFQGDDTGGAGASRQHLDATFARFNVNAEVIEQDQLTVDWGGLLGGDQIDLLWYDSVHLEVPFVRTVHAIHPFLKPNARLAVHDSHFPGSKLAIDSLVSSGRFRLSVDIPVWEGFALLQKN